MSLVDGETPRSRPVIVNFYEPFQRNLIFKNIKKLEGNEKWVIVSNVSGGDSGGQ